MPTTLITPQQIQQATLRVVCGDDQGSAFFISDTLILTARHVIIDAIDEAEPILAYLTASGAATTPLVCKLLGDGGEDLDVALLQVPAQTTGFALPLFNGAVRYNARWETFGYPFAHQISGNRYLGSVRKTNIDKPYDVELINDSIDNSLDYRGLSGAALVIENEVAGLVTYNILDGFGAVSIFKIAEFLKRFNVAFRVQQDADDLPDNLKDDLDGAVPNGATLALLDQRLVSGGKYYVLHGSPGSGKTLISAAYSFRNKSKIIVGRYFVRLPNDQRPISYRVSREAFLEWMEDIISQKLTGSVYPRQSASWDQRVKNFQQLLSALNEYYVQRNELGFIIMDGLDDINTFSENGLVEFLGLFPETLPSNLSFLLAIIRKDSLPPFVQSLITPNEEVKVSPLEIDQCAVYLREKLKTVEPEISFHNLQKIAEKSEGHPLYLRYLTEQLKDNRAPDLPLWIEQLPTIDGDIGKYYERIWLTDFLNDQEKLWIALIVSQLRQPVATAEILQMLPESARMAFLTKFPAIRHLFKVNGKTGIYHSSFSLFIEQKSNELVSAAHDHIATFCNNAEADVYSVTNVVYHILHSTQPLPAIRKCNQDWADACAIISVEPELVLSDIASVEAYCLDLGDFTGFARIKLLSQRIRFRYDNVLAANAASIARVLLAMGNPTDALKYLVRFSVLIVSDNQALWFLRQFNQIGATLEAKRMMRAIRGRYLALTEQAKEDGGMSFRIFDLMAKSTVLNSVNSPRESLQRVTGILGRLKLLADMTENAGQSALDILSLREEIWAYYSGFLTYNSKKYVRRAAMLKKEMPLVPEAEWTGGLAQIALSVDQFLENDKTEEEVSLNIEIVEDVEYAIDNFGYLEKDAPFIYAALLEDSMRPEIVIKLISEVHPTPPLENLRDNNGVDADVSGVDRIIRYYEGRGYLDEGNVYPGQGPLFGSVWEGGLLDHIKMIGFCFGKAFRLRAENKLNELNDVLAHLSNVLLGFGFSLQERSSWERSYAIPEQIFPHLYYKLTRFYIQFAPDKLSEFITAILAKTDGQFGLYTEGFRNALGDIATSLSRSVSAGPLTVSILKKLEEHILLATQNRWERVPALLEIAEIYAKLGNNEKATKVYQQMLDTSMGPTWYKEDQFALINTALSLPNVDSSNPLFQDFGKQLEFAAGELTFQRYVRGAQQEFIGNMASQGNTAAAINYYQYQTLPDAVQIIANAERSTVDAIKLGDGYILGARNIVEASGIHSLLEHIDADPLLIWVFTEVFMINHDIYRYIRQYANLQAKCFSKLSADESSPDFLFLRERLKACVLNKDLGANQRNYLDDLMDKLPKQEYDLLVSSLDGSGISFPQPEPPTKERTPAEDDLYDSMNFPGMGKHSNFRKLPDILARAEQQVVMENKPAATKILAEGLLILHEGKSDIWMGSSLGKDVGKLWDYLAHSGTVAEVMLLLKEPITQQYTQDWRVVEKLLRVLKSGLNADQVKEILEIVKDHIHFMTCDPENVQGFNWEYLTMDTHTSNDAQLLELLVWLLDHPYVSVKKRVIQALLTICKLRPAVISTFLKHALSADNSVVSEICAYLLWHLSSREASLLLETIDFNVELKQRMLEEKHFMIKYYFLKMAENLKTQNALNDDFYKDLFSSFPETLRPGADVSFEEPYTTVIKDIVNSFNELTMLNGAFCRDFLAKITELSKPLTIYGQFRAGHFLERSYHDNEAHYRRGVHILRQAFNLTITSRVTQGNIEQAAAILKNNFLNEN